MKNKLINNAKDSLKLGIISGVGVSAMGSIPGINPGLLNTVSTSVNLANTGQLLKTGLGITSGFSSKKKLGGKLI